MAHSRLRPCPLVAAAMLAAALVRPLAAEPAPAAAAGCALADLPGISAQFSRALRESRAPGGGTGPGLDAAPAADFWRVARAVVGPVADAIAAGTAVTPADGVGGPPRAAVPCDGGVRARDGLAWRLGLGGYSAREIADVVAGHLTPGDLDQARARLMAGHPDEAVAAFLETRWREAPAEGAPAARPAVARAARPMPVLARYDADLAMLARVHGVPADLVRAVVAAESAGDPRAVSPAGAIGLMQLMPGTASSLGVDPWQPRDNLRGGITYLGRLLRAFGENARLALIAYNAGPQHAREVRAGRAVAYRETRQYLAAIDARYPLR